MQRRSLLAMAVLAAPLGVAGQDAWPRRTIRLIVGFDPGGAIDLTARTIQAGLEAGLGQAVVIEYQAGGGGVQAAGELIRAAPDGYTLLLATTGPFAIAPFLRGSKPYEPATQFSFVGQIAEAPYIVAVRSEHPAQDLREFIDWARAHPALASFASSGIGSTAHLNGELLASVAGVALRHVPYRGSVPALTDLIGGQVQLLIDAGSVLLPPIQAGRLKALAVTGSRREPNLANVATVREQGLPGLEAAGFQGLVGPPGLPRDVVARLAAELERVLAQPEVKAALAASGSAVQHRGPQAFAAHVGAEAQRWAALIARLGLATQ